MTDEAFLEAFERGTLPREQWTHAAHFRMAWLYLTRSESEAAALNRVRDSIKNYARLTHSDPAKYHETVTCVYVRLIADRMTRSANTGSWEAFAPELDDMINDYPGPLLRYYREETLLSRRAHETFVAPDVAPLPGGVAKDG